VTHIDIARYSKFASGDVKRAMKRRKTGTLKSGRSGKSMKSKKQAIAVGPSRAKGKKVLAKKSARQFYGLGGTGANDLAGNDQASRREGHRLETAPQS
jgi:hypothetical protein